MTDSTVPGPLRLFEPALLLATAPIALFPERWSRATVLIALGVLWLVRLRAVLKGRSAHAAVHIPVLILLFVALPVSLWASAVLQDTTWIRACCLLWSAALYITVVDWPRRKASEAPVVMQMIRLDVRLVFNVFMAVALLMTTVGIFGMQTTEKMPGIAAIAAQLPGGVTDFLNIPGEVQANELAGLLVVFAPLALALAVAFTFPSGRFRGAYAAAWDAGRPRTRLRRFLRAAVWVLLAVFFLFCLLLTQSRAGILATLIALPVMFLLMGRRGYAALGASVLAGVATFYALGKDAILDAFLYAGKLSGFSVEYFFTGRTAIWDRALFAIRDFPVTGTGFGAFPALAQRMYPISENPVHPMFADAHNFPLQTALDFGIPGAAIWLAFDAVLLYALARLLLRTAPGTIERSWAAGMAGAYVALHAYSLVDCVALGARAGIAHWFFFGLIIAAYNAVRARPKPSLARIRGYGLLALALALPACYLLLPGVRVAVRQNIDARDAVVRMFRRPGELPASAATLTAWTLEDCRQNWLLGHVHARMGDLFQRELVWERLVDCEPRYIRLLALLAPRNTRLSQEAVERHPSVAAGHFWRARQQEDAAPDSAISRYRAGLAIDSTDGLRWRYLGDLLLDTDPRGAIDAYVHSGLNGDPGANGYYLAGRVAERLAAYREAVGYYRLSRYPTAHERARQLELMLKSGKLPASS